MDLLKTEKFKKAKLEWAEAAKKNQKSCALVGFYKENGGMKVAGNTACHASLGYPPLRSPDVLFTGWMKDYNKETGTHDNEELLQVFFHWFKEGGAVWGEGLLNETWEDVRDNGWAFRTDIAHNLLCGALTATRFITEWRPKARTFKYFYERGYTGEEAYIIANQFEYRDTKSNPYMIFKNNDGHLPINGSLTGSLGKNFYNKNPLRAGKTYFENSNYTGFTCEWEHGKSTKSISSFAQGLKPAKVGKIDPSKDIFKSVLWEARVREYGEEKLPRFTGETIDTLGETLREWMKENYA